LSFYEFHELIIPIFSAKGDPPLADNIPLFHYSIIPLLHYPNTPLFQPKITEISLWISIASRWNSV